MKTTTFARRLAATALIVSAGALGFATTAQAKPVMQIDATVKESQPYLSAGLL